jgi:hypothetical protein
VEGKLDHCDRQKLYRQRCSQRKTPPCVTDQGSISITSPALSDCGQGQTIPIAVPNKIDLVMLSARTPARPQLWLHCRFCGRMGRWIDPFSNIPRRR